MKRREFIVEPGVTASGQLRAVFKA